MTERNRVVLQAIEHALRTSEISYASPELVTAIYDATIQAGMTPPESQPASPTPDICTKDDWDGQPIGYPCELCGHTNVAHPGDHNPAVNECALCVLEAKAR